jgi:hypothetical protein
LGSELDDRLLNSCWITYSKSSKKRHHERRRRRCNNEDVSGDKLVTALHKDSSISASPGWTRGKVTIFLWHVADVVNDLAALANGVRDGAKRAIGMSATACIFSNINRPWLAAIDVDLEPSAVAGGGVERCEKHPPARLCSEVGPG